MSNEQIIETFYQSFSNADTEGMINCYHQNIQFQDPAFGSLKGDDVGNMWRMLIARSKNKINISFNNVRATEKTGDANWTAEYIFSQTGRKVINRVSAQFEFQDGKIIKHTDHFNFWKWTQQALGWKGYLLGWTSFMQNKIQERSKKLLNAYKEKL
jgi:ketosteroid isomerase-like protein